MPPVYVLAPDRVQVPVPVLVSLPAPVPIMLARLLPVAVPSRCSANPAPVIVPALDRMISPLLATMLLALPRANNPLYVAAVGELLVKAPPPETPVPFSVRASSVASE